MRRDDGRTYGAFTLLEVLLSVVVIGLLFGAMAMSFGPRDRARGLEEGARRFESLLRFARAEATLRGRRIRLELVEKETTKPYESPDAAKSKDKRPRLLWEPDPLETRGEFEELADFDSLTDDLDELADIVELRVRGQAADSLTFYPDGSSDSAEFKVRAQADNDRREIVVRVFGTTGFVERSHATQLREEQRIESDRSSGSLDP